MARKPRQHPKPASQRFVAPELPPITEAEQRLNAEMVARLEEMSKILRQRNLDNAVLLAEMAARSHGPLVNYFAELGRRYAELLTEPPKASLRVIDGGAAGK